MHQLFDDREAWLTEAAQLLLDDLITPVVEAKGYTYQRPPIRISVGFPKHTRGGKAIAVCFARAASTDGVNEIFVNPEIDEPEQVLGTLAHELVHAYDDCESGHQHFFAAIARGIGLEGKLRSTEPGLDLRKRLAAYHELLGKYPHSRMNTDVTHKKGGTRQLKVTCTGCGFIFRTSAKWAAHIDDGSTCPVCRVVGSLELDQ